jgi:hypothetical protein
MESYGVRRAPLTTEVLATLAHIAAETSGVLVVGALGKRAAIPRRLLSNDHLCQPPPSAL